MNSCLILAAGEGKRLRPFTNNSPKALVSLFGNPLISYQINNLKALNFNNIGITTGYKEEKILTYNFKTFHNKFFDTTNMVESLFIARLFLEQAQGDILISYGDIVYEKRNLKKVLNTKGDIVVMIDEGWLDLWSIRNDNPLNDAETLKYGPKGQILELGKKPKSLLDISGQYTGLIKISYNKIQDFISFYDQLDRSILYEGRTFKQMYLTTFLQLLINAGWMVMPATVNHGWLEVDTVEDLLIYEKLNKEGKLDYFWKKNE